MMTAPPKPHTPPFRAENVPPELVALNHWLLWQRHFHVANGKWTKIPRQPNGEYAKSTRPETWSTFSAALEAYRTGRFDGLGIALAGDGLVGIDLDHCIVDGVVKPWAQEIVDAIDSYTESSPSGAGLRIFARGFMPRPGAKKGDLEMYSSLRYLTVTGDHLESSPRTVNDRHAEIAAMFAKFFPEPPPLPPPPPRGPMTLDDAELLDRMFRSRLGDELAKLWHGDCSSYASHSEADYALCKALAFWTQRDVDRIDSLFRRSGLMRQRWDQQRGDRTYGRRTIDAAVRRTFRVFGDRA